MNKNYSNLEKNTVSLLKPSRTIRLLLMVFFVCSFANATDYYSKSTGNLNTQATWGTNTDGSGTAPSNFTTAGNIFYIRNNTSPTIATSWTVSGSGSKIVLGDGVTAINFTVGSNYVVTATMDILASGTLTLTTSGTTAITFGALAITSTVNYAELGAQPVLAGTYGNLILSGSGTKTFASSLTITNNLSIPTGLTANLGAFTHTANSLTLGGTPRAAGSWGNASSSATNNSTLFSATTGIVMVEGRCSTAVTVMPNKVDKCSTSNNGRISPTFTGGLANVRYIKLTQKYNNSLHLAEIEAREVFTGTNVALGGVASHSAASVYSPYVPAMINDGISNNNANMWHSVGTLNDWIQIDLQSAKNLDYLRIHNRTASNYDRAQNILLELFDGSNNLIYCKTINVWEGVNAARYIDVNILSLSWSDAATSLNRTGLAAGTYTLNYADGAGYAVNTSITIVAADPTITTAATPAVVTPVCQSASAQTTTMAYTATTNNPTSYSIDWTGLADQVSTPFAFVAGGGNVTGITVPAGTVANTYTGTMTVTNANGCTGTQTVTLIVNALPTAGLTSSDTDNIFCAGTSVIFTATGGTNYNFRVGGSSVQNSAVATYTTTTLTNGQVVDVIVTNASTCSATSSGITNTVNALPTAGLTSSDADNIFCAGTSVTFTATGGTNYNFRVAGSSVQNSAVATYTTTALTNGQVVDVIVTNASSCSATSSGIINTVNPLPTVTNTPLTQTICSGGSSTLVTLTSGVAGTTFAWTATATAGVTGFAASGTGTIPVQTISTTGTTQGTVTYVITPTANGCPGPITNYTVLVNPLPNNVSNGFSATTMCVGDIPQLTFDAVDATFSTPYSITYRNDVTLAQFTIPVTVASSFSFTPADSPSINTSYTLVSISNANCTNATIASFGDSGANLIVRPIPIATISGTTTVCVGSPSPNIVFANPQSVAILVTYNINGGGNLTAVVASSGTSNIAVPTAGSGSFVYNLVGVAYLDAAPSCTNVISGSATVTVNSLSVAPTGITGTATICNGDSTTLTLSGGTAGTGAVAQWFTASCGGTSAGTGNSITVSPTSNTTYYVRYSGTCNTTACASTTVTVNSLPATPIPAIPTQPNCITPTGSVEFSGLPAGSWTINPGGYTGTGITTTISGLTPGTYNFTVFNGNCTSAPTGNVVINSTGTKTWNGTAWSPDAPTSSDVAIINGNYSASTSGDLNVCSLTINAGYRLSIESDKFVVIQNDLTIANGAILDVLDKGSLVMVNDSGVVTNTGTGTAIVHRRTTPFKKNDYIYWSTPVSTTAISSAATGAFPGWRTGYAYRYNNAWVAATTMTPGNGYIIMVPDPTALPGGNESGAVFKGIVNNGVYNINIVANKSYLIGNPYPSAIDADQFILDNSGVIGGALYFWTHATAIQLASNIPGTAGSGAYAFTSDDYATYNIVGGVGAVTAGNTNSDSSKIIVPNGKIASGQGFFTTTKASSLSGTSFVFKNSMRISSGTGSNSQFFKTKDTQINKLSASVIEKHRVWLNFSNTQGAFKQTLLGYVSGATNDNDVLFDGKTLDGNKFVDFYSVNQSKNLVIQGRALPFDNKDEVPLGYKTTIDGTFTINIDKVDGLLINKAIFLEDKLTKTVFNLKTGNYTFSTVKGTFNDRFVLKYSDRTLGTEDFEAQANKVLVSVKNKQIKINSFTEMIDKVLIYDVSGKQIYKNEHVDNNELSVTNFTAADQVLIVKTTLLNGLISTDKIVY